jgi:hypothetical protein
LAASRKAIRSKATIASRFLVLFLAFQFHQAISNSSFITSVSKRYLMIYAGFPPTILYAETSFTTTDLLAIIDPLPIFTPGIIFSQPLPNI